MMTNNAKVHFGRIFFLCPQKVSELPEGSTNEKWEGRSVCQGNRVRDEHHDHALFAELGSSPASMESGKILQHMARNQASRSGRRILGRPTSGYVSLRIVGLVLGKAIQRPRLSAPISALWTP